MMKKYLITLLLMLMSVFTGATVVWVQSYDVKEPIVSEISLKELFRYSNTAISPDNFSCEGDVEKKVGAVTASIFESNLMFEKNQIIYGCHENICTLTVSFCKPWKMNECSSRILKFETDENKQIKASTFVCLDIP